MWRTRIGWCAGRCASRIVTVEGEIVDIDTITVRHQNHALDQMAELADVTEPLIGAQRVHSCARDEFYVLAEQAVEMLDKMGDEHRKCLAPFAKRRHTN